MKMSMYAFNLSFAKNKLKAYGHTFMTLKFHQSQSLL